MIELNALMQSRWWKWILIISAYLIKRWDYKAAELGDYKLNITTFWIDMFAKIGWAYDLKQPSSELVRKTIEKHGKVWN